MGQYTRLVGTIRLKPLPAETVALMQKGLQTDSDAGIHTTNALFFHPLFLTSRYDQLFLYKFIGDDTKPVTNITDNVLWINSEIKNHEEVYEKFLDWIAPFVESVSDLAFSEDHDLFEEQMPVEFEEGKFWKIVPMPYGEDGDEPCRTLIYFVTGSIGFTVG